MEIYHQDRQISTDTCYPVGAVLPFAGLTPADGWLLCDGAAYDQSDYPELYEVIGDLYRTTATGGSFNVPDLRERFVEGSGIGNYDVGKNVEPSIPSHKHSFTGTAATSTSQGSHTHTRGDMNITCDSFMWAYGYGNCDSNWQGCITSASGYNNNVPNMYNGSVAHYGTIQLDASKGWIGASSQVGNHTHTFTAKGTVGKAGDSLAIYKGTTVQPKSVCMNFIIRCK